MSRAGALDGITVVELAQVFAVPHAGQLLAADGARVLKIEPPAGDLARRQGALLPGGTSTSFETFNRGKELATADLRDPADRERVAALAAAADVFITNQDLEFLRSFGLDYASLSAANPRLVYGELSAFGPGGPIGTDGLAQAASGMTDLTGPPDGRGFRSGVSAVDVAAGVWLAFGIAVALHERARTGRGKLVQLSLQEVALGLAMAQLSLGSVLPERMRRMGNLSLTSCTPVFLASDGRVFTTIMDDRHWRRFCTALGRPDLIQDPRFADDDARFAHQAEIEAELNPAFAGGTRDEWVERLRRERVPCAAERMVAEVLADPDLRARGLLYRHSVGDIEMTQVAIPFQRSTST